MLNNIHLFFADTTLRREDKINLSTCGSAIEQFKSEVKCSLVAVSGGATRRESQADQVRINQNRRGREAKSTPQIGLCLKRGPAVPVLRDRIANTSE